MTVRKKRESAKADPVAGWVVILTSVMICGYLFMTNGDPKDFETYSFINTGLCLWMPLVVLLVILRAEPAEYGLSPGNARLGLPLCLIFWVLMIVPLIIVSYRPEFRSQYLNYRLMQNLVGVGPVYNGLHVSAKSLVYYEMGMGFYMFCWEFFFRGYLLFGLRKLIQNDVWAIVLQTIPFVLLHWSMSPGAGKPAPEIASAIPGGIVLGILAIRTKSCVYGFLTHWLVSATFDLLLLLHIYR